MLHGNAGAGAASSATAGYTTQYTIKLSGVVKTDALRSDLRKLLGTRPETRFTLIGQCPTSNGAPDGWGMINLPEIGEAFPLFFKITPAPPGALPGLGSNGFEIAERLRAQQIVIDPEMSVLHLTAPALLFLAPANSAESNWMACSPISRHS